MITAYKVQEIIGSGRLISDGALYALVCDIMMMPDYQNKGIGSVILNQLVKKCQGADLRRVWLFAAPGKAGFYEKHGFSVRSGKAPGMQLGEFEYVPDRIASETSVSITNWDIRSSGEND